MNNLTTPTITPEESLKLLRDTVRLCIGEFGYRPEHPFIRGCEYVLAATSPDNVAAHVAQQVLDGWQLVPKVPTEDQWGGLARDIVMWMDMGDKHTPRNLFKHLERLGADVPQWLRDEPEMKNLDHVPSKGCRAAIIYKAMLAAAQQGDGK